jgi:hypothetical protein
MKLLILISLPKDKKRKQLNNTVSNKNYLHNSTKQVPPKLLKTEC